MAWIVSDDTGEEYGIIEYLMRWELVDQHFVIEVSRTHQRFSYFHIRDVSDLDRSIKLAMQYLKGFEFYESEGPELTGTWLTINTDEDYIDILKLIPNSIKDDYFVNYDLIKSYGVIYHGTIPITEDSDYFTIYIQFRNDETGQEIKDMLESEYGIQSRMARLARKK